MAYTPTVWKNGEFPPIDAEHLNKIEQGIANSAPGGFGFGGEPIKTVSVTSKDETYESFCARLDVVMSEMPNNSVKLMHIYPPQIYGKTSSTCSIVYQHTDGYCGVYNIGMPDPTCSQWRMIKVAGVWQPFEWVNPPMDLGVEYRTTERYLGKPVYVKVVDCGNLPDGTTKEVAHGIADIAIVVYAQAIASNSTAAFNGRVYMPTIYNGSLTDRWTVYLAGVDTQNIRIFCGGGLAGCPVYVTMRYTKTTD